MSGNGERNGDGVFSANGSASGRRGPALITGGAGFVGTNLAARLLEQGERVLIYDSLARPGVERNVLWLRQRFGEHLEVELSDIRDRRALHHAVARAGSVFHLAAQVAVTTSLQDPLLDFEVNLAATFQLLDALRARSHPPPLLFTSTNKVYGSLEGLPLERHEKRYAFTGEAARHGISEERRLEFQTPYGCSKGAADQYVLDFARCFRLPAVVFRMSCIYGPHQLGSEDQGWVAHMARRVLAGRPIEILGDGRQVRDLLYVEDLVDAMLLVRESAPRLAGRPFNVGGGPANTCSLLELIELLGRIGRRKPRVRFGAWRAGDQACYVSDIRSFQKATGWTPRVGVGEGVRRLHAWLTADRPDDKSGAEPLLRRVADTQAHA